MPTIILLLFNLDKTPFGLWSPKQATYRQRPGIVVACRWSKKVTVRAPGRPGALSVTSLAPCWHWEAA